ncbi:unnamed protein product [Lactuca virosa]|uniref:SGS domain-containing protein n=1 Tax=Lactuca virosa TaxID=75947 RepID=A0AAU9M3W4_9ASTR|nr:unnamed protein product [Lactuca virosa]
MQSMPWKSTFSVTVVCHFYLLSRRVALTLSCRHDQPPSRIIDALGVHRFVRFLANHNDRIQNVLISFPLLNIGLVEENVELPTQSSDKPEEVVVTIFAKGIAANRVSINYGEQIISVTIDVHGEDSYIFQPRFFGKIVPARCRFEVLSTKVEIQLVKAEPIQWTSLEYGNNNLVAQRSNVSSGNQRPAYPSSKPTKDWDKLEAQVKKEEKDEKLDGDAALNKFFRDIYKDADDDTRRAMRKSFVESNGTVLSTNWTEVEVNESNEICPSMESDFQNAS